MKQSTFETFKYADPTFLITFHDQQMVINRPTGFFMHWHEHVEILLCTSGMGVIELEDRVCAFAKGDVLIVNSNITHNMPEKSPQCAYHCLIIDKRFANSLGIPIDELWFREQIQDEKVSAILIALAEEMEEMLLFYKARVQAYAAQLLVLLAREYAVASSLPAGGGQKQNSIKKAIGYISAHYEEPLSVEQIAAHVGISKYYFCRAFKEVTGQRVVDYINMMRCSHARKMLGMGRYNISESAFASGFNNLSYFTRTYRRFMGVTPSEDLLSSGNKKIFHKT